MSSTSTLIWLRSDDPAASYREVVEPLLRAWAARVPIEIVQRIAAAIAAPAEADSAPDPLRDGTTVTIELPAAAIVPGAAGGARVDLTCRAIVAPPATEDVAPIVVGRAIDVAVHPVPTIGGPDLSDVVTITALALAIGGTEVTRPGWAWALAIPGTSWVIGRPEVPGLAYGIGVAEERKPARGVTEWRKQQRQRLEAARAALDEMPPPEAPT